MSQTRMALFLIILLSLLGCEDKKKKPILDINYTTGEELVIENKGGTNLSTPSSIGESGEKRLKKLEKLPPPSPPTPVSKIESSPREGKEVNTSHPKITIYQLGDYNITFRGEELIKYPRKRLYLLFSDGGRYCRLEEQFLKELKIPYFVIKDADLDREMNITIYPTIVILDKNRTIRYEGFTPYEILQAETYFQLGQKASHKKR